MAIATVDPATGKMLKKFEALGAAEIDEKLRRATRAFSVNRRRSFADRAQRMSRVATLLEDRATEYGRLITTEMGKPINAAIAEVKKCATACRYYAANAE